MSEENLPTQSQILLYQTEDGRQHIEVHLQGETVWLSQKGMAELFQTTPQNINIHLKNIFSEGKISQDSVTKDSLITASDGKKYRTQLYRLEAIIAVVYRVNSHRGTQFCQWATQRLQEYIVKEFTLDDERLSKPRGIDYFGDLLDRIRAIRASEKRFYQTWSDWKRDGKECYTKDELLTNITLYWVAQTISSSMRLYYEFRKNPWILGPGERIEVPTSIHL